MNLLQLISQIQTAIDRLPPRLRSRKFWIAIGAIALNFRNPAAILRIVTTYIGIQGAEDVARQLRLPGNDSLEEQLRNQGLDRDDVDEILIQIEKLKANGD